MKTANLAIVFTDIKGFTERTSRQTLKQNERLLQMHSALLTPLFRACGGRIIKSIGDAFLVTFESPTQAVLCGAAIQDRLWQHNRTTAEAERLEVRVAINVGEVRLESGDVFGEPVNIAARVEGIAEAGEVYFTEAVYLSMNKADVPAEEVGAFELKGIPGKVRVFRVPRAPYRVQPAPVGEAPAATSTTTSGDQPPFGNLGLARLPESALEPAARLGGEVISRRRAPLVLAGLAGLVVMGGLVAHLSRSELDAAIDAVAEAPEAGKPALAKHARKLIAEEKDSSQAAFATGRLEEALGNPGQAINQYESAARSGHRQAQDRLINLLKSPDCALRRSAAQALGELKLKRARGALRGLAEGGGPGDNDIPLFGCNSKRAAQEALRRME